MTKQAVRVGWGAVVGALALVLGCGGGSGPGVGHELSGAVIAGHVEALGAPDIGIGGVEIQMGSRTATTNEQGWYIFDDVPASTRTTLRAHADGYVGAVEWLPIEDGAAYHVDFVVVPASAEQTVSASAGGTITAAGIALTIPANAFVTSSGAAASGSVTVTVGAIDPGASGQAGDAFPGDFVGMQTDGTELPLESFGVFAIEARQGTELLQLASGKSIDVLAPIAASGVASAPASIAFWSLDETSGRWVEEGTATREGDSYRASVPHLSWWNFDRLYRDRTTCIRVCVASVAGRSVAGVRIHVAMPEVHGNVLGYTDATGCVSMNVRSNTAVDLEASYADGTVVAQSFTTQALVTSTNEHPPMCQDVGPLVLDPMIAQAVLTWGPEPSDLDSHMTGPSSTGRFHTYYGSRGSPTAEPWCMLDTDDTSAYGPEVITLNRTVSGVYRYSIHNYSGQSSHPIESSGARVVVIVPELGRSVSYTPPTSNPANGDLWRVFELHAEGGAIVDIVSINDIVQAGSSSGPAYNP